MHSTVMRSGERWLCAFALISTVGVVVCARDVGRLMYGRMLTDVHVVSGLRKVLENSELDKDLLRAATVGDATRVQRFLDAGSNPNALHKNRLTTPLIMASSRGYVDVVLTLLNAGVDVNFANKYGDTALHFAASRGYASIVDLLLDSEADVRAENIVGWTPLFDASKHGHAKALEILIDAGGDVSHQDEDGWTPLHIGARYDHLIVVKLLLKKGANPEVETFELSRTPISLAAIDGSGILIQTLIDAGADKNHKVIYSMTPLILAAYFGNQEAIKVLVENGADKSVVSEFELRAKEVVCLCTRVTEINPSCDVEICKEPGIMSKLLEYGREYSKGYLVTGCSFLITVLILETFLLLCKCCCRKRQ